MVFDVSAVLLFGLIVFLLMWYAGLKASHMLASLLFGFFLATSPAGPFITRLVSDLSRLLTGA